MSDKCDKCGRVSLSEEELKKQIFDYFRPYLHLASGSMFSISLEKQDATANGICDKIAKSICTHFSARVVVYPENKQDISISNITRAYDRGYNHAIETMRRLNEGERE